MTGVSLSRWTMSYFATALLALVGAELLMVSGFGFPAAGLREPETLILVHLVAIGWLSLLMCGALFQFVPVLVAQPLYSDRLPAAALLLLLAGLVALILGFLQIAGKMDSAVSCLPAAGTLLGLGFSLVLWNLIRTLGSVATLPVPARFVTVGLLSLAGAATFGIIFTFVLGGLASFEPLVKLAQYGLPSHIVAGLGGWLTFTAIGVSYRLFAMFMLAPELERPTTRWALRLGAIALALAILGGAAAILLGPSLDIVLVVTAGIGVAALLLYKRDILHIYRKRKRRKLELNSRGAILALFSLTASVLLLVLLLASGRLAEQIGAFIFLVAFGWLSGLGLAQLYKVVAFLTWLECYGPVLGKAPTPRVQDLVVEQRTAKWFWLYFTATWSGTATLLAGYPMLFRLTAAAMLMATLGIIVELLRTRRLSNVANTVRFPAGVRRPLLLLSLAPKS